MNAQDRKQVSELVSTLEDLQSKFAEAQQSIQDLADAEREKFDNMSEGLQAGEKGQAIDTAASALEDAAQSESIQETLDALGNIE